MKTNIPHQQRNSGTVICGGNGKCTCPGKEHEIVLILYDEAAYLKDDTDGVRILFTGRQDKQKVQDEVHRLLEEHKQWVKRLDEFRTGTER